MPQVDGLGNEMSGVRGVEVRAPLATYAPWSLRTSYAGGADEMMDFLGTFAPLPRTETERAAGGDPRPSLEALYGDRAAYIERVRLAASDLVAQGFMLPEDLDEALSRAGAVWDWIQARPESGTTAAR